MDPLLSTVEYSMGGLQLRLDTIADNIANSNTPNYTSRRVDFERGLLAALNEGEPAPDHRAKVTNGMDLVDVTGNSVSLENELTDMTKSSLTRQVMVSAYNYKLDMLRAGAGVQR